LFNFKYTDDGNTTPGQTRFGQLQLAPSNTTNLNPALTLQSGRVNGLGVGGSIFLDSSYGTPEVPLVIAAETPTSANANTLTMLSNAATVPGGVRTIFSKKTGYAPGVVVDQENQFATKAYDDSVATGQEPPDLSAYVQKAGDIMTGNLTVPEPTEDGHAATKKYVDDAIDSLVIPDPDLTGYVKTDGTSTITRPLLYDNSVFIANPLELTHKTYVDTKLSLGGGTMLGALTLSGPPLNPLEAATRRYVDDSIAAIDIPEPPLDEYLALEGGTMTGDLVLNANPSQPLGAVTKQYADSLVAGVGSGDFKADGSVSMTGDLNLGNNKIIGVINGVNDNDVMNKGYIDGEISVLQGLIDNLGTAFT